MTTSSSSLLFYFIFCFSTTRTQQRQNKNTNNSQNVITPKNSISRPPSIISVDRDDSMTEIWKLLHDEDGVSADMESLNLGLASDAMTGTRPTMASEVHAR
jgi:hypothetical protein